METEKGNIEKLVEILKDWQKIEDATIRNTTEIIKKTDNPLVHLVMEIIRQDSVMHRRVQQLIIDNYEKQPITLFTEEISNIWSLVEEHNEVEKKTIAIAKEALQDLTSPIVKYLLEYLLYDETKHDNLLEEIENIRKGMNM